MCYNTQKKGCIRGQHVLPVCVIGAYRLEQERNDVVPDISNFVYIHRLCTASSDLVNQSTEYWSKTEPKFVAFSAILAPFINDMTYLLT